ncbi:cobalt-precorrin 5A hydrolase [Pectinatus haikarae]|uniref:cobalt-precorrin 5A hydrolase n=1 Tax=Pectinatus haikarae TaxID=349096 RepID=UPI0018C5A2B6|nr:cobalt-precorrin 5A hydrolase [Pectinatus haikarae]
MRYAIIAVTANGALLAEKLRGSLGAVCDVYGKTGKYKEGLPVISFTKMRDIMPAIFARYDGVIFFCAVGIAVRMTAPYIVKKDVDPAVVVIDEQGRYAVSLLSGHLGGANELAEKAAAVIGAVPVITTATDIGGMEAPDIVARRLGFLVSPLANVKIINTALLAGKTINYYIDKELPHGERFLAMLKKQGISAKIFSIQELDGEGKPLVLLTDKVIEAEGILCFLRHKLIAGVGCRRKTQQQHIEECLKKACRLIDYDIDEITLIASTQVKADEEGILLTAGKYGIPLKFWDNESLKKSIEYYGLKESAFVRKQIGVGNVCEAAALAGGKSKLVLNKTKFEKVTVALAWEK